MLACAAAAATRSRVFDDPDLFDLILSNLNAKSLARAEQVASISLEVTPTPIMSMT